MKIFQYKKIGRNGQPCYMLIAKLDDGYSSYTNVAHPNEIPEERHWNKTHWPVKRLIEHFTNEGYLSMKKEIVNDLDWLDAIQDNFKEGV